MELSVTTRDRVRHAVAVHPDGGYRHDAYRFEDHGLDEATEREKFSGYTRFFGIEAEPRSEDGSHQKRAA